MSPIESKVRVARLRLLLGRFARHLCWTLAAAWLITGIAIVAGSIWELPWDPWTWAMTWMAVGSSVAVLVAAIGCWWTSPSLLTVASEIDRRFAMKQRLGSVVAMREPERQSAMGRALIEDTARRAETLQIAEKFRLAPSRLGWLPVGSAALVVLALLLGPAVTSNASSKLTPEMLAQAEQVKRSTEVLKKKVSDQRKKAESAGLKDAAEMFTKLEADIEKLEKRDAVDAKQAMIAINDLKKQLDERRKQLGSPESMQQTLAKMSEHDKGPAESIVKAIKEGEFAEATEQAKALADKIRNHQLTPAEKKALQAQVEKLRDQMQQAVEKHEAQKQQLQKQIDEAKREGRGQDAAKMQQQLNELQVNDGQMQKMQKMAESLSAGAQAMGQGDSEQAAQALEGIADQLEGMQAAMEQLQDIEETLDTLSQSKDQMRCKSCSGQGCQRCQGNGFGDDGMPSDGPGKGGTRYGLGKGSGLSGPEEQDKDAQSYESQVRGNPKQGRGLNAGFADGPNRKGATREDVKQAVLSAISDESDPLENQTLPRTEREHAKEYFDKLRGGK